MRQFFEVITCVGGITEIVEYRNLLDANSHPFVYYHEECDTCGDLRLRTEEVEFSEVIDLMKAGVSLFLFEDTNNEIQNILIEEQREARITMLERIENELRHHRRHLKFV